VRRFIGALDSNRGSLRSKLSGCWKTAPKAVTRRCAAFVKAHLSA